MKELIWDSGYGYGPLAGKSMPEIVPTEVILQ